jgi:YidC/Oxa1 family membrane protein insertase
MLDFLAPFWNTFIFNPMINLLLGLYTIIGNYGFAIIIFTLIIRVITLPFYAQQQKAMRKQQLLSKSKEWQDMQKKYAKDKEKLAQEQMRLYREGGVNPLGGCLPALIPWPIMIGLYQSITMVMGSQPEQLMELAKHLYPIASLAAAVPVRSDFFGLNLAGTPQALGGVAFLIPVLVGASTWVQQKMIAMPTGDAQSAQMSQSMQVMMPIMIGWFSLNFPMGLALYWIVFSVVGIAQQYFQGGWGNLFGNSSTTALATVTDTGKGKKNGKK